MERRLRRRLRGTGLEEPISLRWRDQGDYHIPSMLLKEELEAEGQKALTCIHARKR